jgi:hypothetical protein
MDRAIRLAVDLSQDNSDDIDDPTLLTRTLMAAAASTARSVNGPNNMEHHSSRAVPALVADRSKDNPSIDRKWAPHEAAVP